MTVLGILGVVHDDDLRQKYQLSLDCIKELIIEFNPDVICGEVLPESWKHYNNDSSHRGYWGEPASEYWDLIFPLCEAEQIEFVPIDWVELDVWMDFDLFKGYNEQKQQELNMELEQWFERQLAAIDASDLPFNSLTFDRVAKQKYEWLAQINPQAHMVRWICRHLIMIQRIKNAVKEHSGKRLLCIVGADHNHALHEVFVADNEIQLVYPLRE